MGRTSPLHLRLLIDEPADGPMNMAIDEVLLESAALHDWGTVRIYRWSTPTLSLGYFQRLMDREQHAASEGRPVVRRRSGGGAILHDVELTYSLSLPLSHLPVSRPDWLYQVIHEAWLTTLRRTMGLAGRMLQGDSPACKSAFLCFERRSSFDVLAGDFKILGSAQRRFRSAVLQHGSLLLGRSKYAPELPGIADLLGLRCETEPLISQWCHEVGKWFDCPLQPAPLANEERDRVNYHATRYGSRDWTARRN
jgi:lipoate-protein ligase A